ncbi:DnaJ-class molecular chaperone with C-terminal Zn finger domain [Mesorhizobium sp. J18]|uniref:DnaJ domain-containing protein n=1 Tax=Mesorhizobium sp. J18 TaxID=935263 RepID=UPI001199B21A|nr:DnaJ domain-containing protein [Mesorhizobium sp. J18]TWG99076.1 DnaJ-class molecular chaperone with C-terminal Zn finger domain [Mesorhizobium sp. J18]
MTVPFVAFALLLVFLLAASLFLSASAASIAGSIRYAGPIVLGMLGLVLMLAGRAAIGGMLISAAVAWFGSGRFRRTQAPAPGQRSTVGTAALEMELDHDSGTLDGMVIAGRFEGRPLNQMSLEELLDLRMELAADNESLQLLETYLDGKFPVWREGLHADDRDRQGGTPASSSMTKEEAYKILGLEAGAAATEIRKAHRRLMQRLHPDAGGSSFLAARINEARDILLSDHD